MEVDARTLDVRFRPSAWWRELLPMLVLLVVLGAGWRWGVFPTALAVVVGLVLLVALGAVAAVAVRAARQPWLARLDEVGVTLPDCPVVPWSDLAAVEVRPFRSTQVVGRPRLVVVFLPRPGASLPGAGGRGLLRWAGAARVRRFGTPLVLPVFATDATAADVSSSAARLGGLPVVERGPAAGPRVAAFVLLGVLAVLVVLLALATAYLVL